MLRKRTLNSLPISRQASNGGNACFTAFSCFPGPQNFCTTGCFSGICTAPHNSLHRILELEEVLLPYGYRNRIGTVKRLLSVTWPGTAQTNPDLPFLVQLASPNAVSVAPYFTCNMESFQFGIWKLIYQKHFKCNVQINKLGMWHYGML